MKFRAPLHFTIIPKLTLADLKTLAADLTDILAETTTIVIACKDQLNPAELTINQMFEANMSQCSMAPINETQVGLQVSAKASIGDDRIGLFAAATNAKQIQAASPNNTGEPELITMADNAGLTFGDTDLPYKTVLMRPYSGNTPTTNVARWYIFPETGIKGNVTASFGLQNQFSYEINFTAFDSAETGLKVLRGDTTLIP